MFPRMNITTPLPSFAYGTPQYSAGMGFGGISPVLPYVASPSPISYPVIGPSPYVSSPAPVPYPVIGPSPFAVQPALPYPQSPISAGISPFSAGVNPFSAGINPFSAISPWGSPLSWNPYAFAQATPSIPAIHPALAALASSAFCNPVTCIDPATGAVAPQPYPAAQSLLPIRPLIAAAQAVDPVQVAAMCAMAAPSLVDPYSVLSHAPATLPVSQVPPMMRSPLYMSAVAAPMVGVPCTVTAGIPC